MLSAKQEALSVDEEKFYVQNFGKGQNKTDMYKQFQIVYAFVYTIFKILRITMIRYHRNI